MNRSISGILAAVLSGLLFWLGWPPNGIPVFLFIGFVPLLFIEDQLSKIDGKKPKKLFLYIYPGFLIWNGLSTWWLYNASPAGGIMTSVLNALLMCIPFLLFHITKNQIGNRVGYISLPVYWIAFEYLHHNWELAWTWLTLGNGLAEFPRLIQWYEYTGVLGGSLWILMVNILLFLWLKKYLVNVKSIKNIPPIAYISLILQLFIFGGLPAIISNNIFNNYSNTGSKIEVVVVQPNIDPYHEKFTVSPIQQLQKLIRLSDSLITPGTDYLIWPETAIPDVYIDEIDNSAYIKLTKRLIEKTPDLKLVTGFTAIKEYFGEKKEPTPSARWYSDGTCCYDVFNSAIQINNSSLYQVYHKSKLVPGVESIPYQNTFPFLKDMAIDLGGAFGSLGRQKDRAVFFSKDSTGIAPLICYESVFGEYVTEYVEKGANALFVVTNDGWWGDTPGHKQHLYFSTLRAIETRRSVARSANTGISCFINQKGEILQPTNYWENAVIRHTIKLNDAQTFYVANGDYIGRVALVASVLQILILISSTVTHKFRYRS